MYKKKSSQRESNSLSPVYKTGASPLWPWKPEGIQPFLFLSFSNEKKRTNIKKARTPLKKKARTSKKESTNL